MLQPLLHRLVPPPLSLCHQWRPVHHPLHSHQKCFLRGPLHWHLILVSRLGPQHNQKGNIWLCLRRSLLFGSVYSTIQHFWGPCWGCGYFISCYLKDCGSNSLEPTLKDTGGFGAGIQLWGIGSIPMKVKVTSPRGVKFHQWGSATEQPKYASEVADLWIPGKNPVFNPGRLRTRTLNGKRPRLILGDRLQCKTAA